MQNMLYIREWKVEIEHTIFHAFSSHIEVNVVTCFFITMGRMLGKMRPIDNEGADDATNITLDYANVTM
ncbi:hypothetical protein OUZ56_026715 [Daphnia magna]|uniref:Uncharacterized protein n=1 Tax=Daphnia magna TaxID=35525 RepID=A0ABQ9ZMP9_9CRUS|nr:hypothetical protein OUZ56_026715 [Daphnia magna]